MFMSTDVKTHRVYISL